MQDIFELSIGVTNLTLCLPVTLAKAWHISRKRSEGIINTLNFENLKDPMHFIPQIMLWENEDTRFKMNWMENGPQ